MAVRAKYKFCHTTGTVLPIHEARALDDKAYHERQLANVAHGYIPDEMEPTKHPITGEYFTSKAKFRAVTRAHGCEEVGTAYENGYAPEKELHREWQSRMKDVKQGIREQYGSEVIRENMRRYYGR